MTSSCGTNGQTLSTWEKSACDIFLLNSAQGISQEISGIQVLYRDNLMFTQCQETLHVWSRPVLLQTWHEMFHKSSEGVHLLLSQKHSFNADFFPFCFYLLK